jgi:hypothetical protein
LKNSSVTQTAADAVRASLTKIFVVKAQATLCHGVGGSSFPGVVHAWPNDEQPIGFCVSLD